MKTIPTVALGLLVAVIAIALAACTSEEATPNLETGAKPIPAAAATGTPAIGVATPVSAENSAPSQTAPAETAAEAAQRFAEALVSGDLTALTLSFAPTGLNQARILGSQSGVEGAGAGAVTTANVQSAVKLPDPTPTWDVVLAISTADTDSSLLSRWRWFVGIGWRIVGLETGPRG